MENATTHKITIAMHVPFAMLGALNGSLWRPSQLNDITQQSTNGLLLLYDASILHYKQTIRIRNTHSIDNKTQRSPKSRKIGFADEIRSRDSDPCSFNGRPLSLFVRYCWSCKAGAIQHRAAANTKRPRATCDDTSSHSLLLCRQSRCC